jgi:SAM-dependent methyltransferase
MRGTGEAAMRAFYESNLALIHNASFGALAIGAGRAVLAYLRESGAEGTLVDLGCGSGVLAEQISVMGHPVVGIDLSPQLLGLARQRVPEGRFILGSIYDVALPPASAVTMIGEVVNYVDEGRPTPADLEGLFTRIHAALEPGGLLLFDAAAPRQGAAAITQAFRHGPDWTVLIEAREDPAATLTREITTFRRAGDLYRREDERHVLRLWARDEVLAMLARAGFSATIFDRYDDVRLPDNLIGYRALKPR